MAGSGASDGYAACADATPDATSGAKPYTCTCPHGYTNDAATSTEPAGATCTDVDEVHWTAGGVDDTASGNSCRYCTRVSEAVTN